MIPDGTSRCKASGELAVSFAIATGSELESKELFDVEEFVVPEVSDVDQIFNNNFILAVENGRLKERIEQLELQNNRWRNWYYNKAGKRKRKQPRKRQ